MESICASVLVLSLDAIIWSIQDIDACVEISSELGENTEVKRGEVAEKQGKLELYTSTV